MKLDPRLSLCLLLASALLFSACGRKAPPALNEGRGQEQVGVASWYGKEFQGRPTASGERYDLHALTAAHRTLPFGTRVKVTNLENGRSVIVRINDRGPNQPGRLIDLSYAAARQIGLVANGTAKVRIEILP